VLRKYYTNFFFSFAWEYNKKKEHGKFMKLYKSRVTLIWKERSERIGRGKRGGTLFILYYLPNQTLCSYLIYWYKKALFFSAFP
jgi:hypothetical protein